MESHTILFMFSDDTDLLAIIFDEESYGETPERVPSDRAGNLQETSSHPPYWENHGLEKG